MNNGVCSRAAINDTAQLVDKRDNKTYWIAKLANGSCWMVQNLDLDLYNSETNQPVVLTSELSDADWVSTTGASDTWNGTTSYYDSGLQLCNGSSCGPASGEYDSHYLVGNYYTWDAATANTGASLSSGSASSSICPRGWQLPENGAYASLFTAYGALQSGTPIYGSQNITLSPLYFISGGYVLSSGFHSVGSAGYYWSATTFSASYAYFLLFSSSGVNPSSYNGRSRINGFSVRCVAR